jgi:hypothetical protein
MRCVHLGESEKSMLKHPFPRWQFFDPMTSDSKIAIGIRSLPRITGKANLAAHNLALCHKLFLSTKEDTEFVRSNDPVAPASAS